MLPDPQSLIRRSGAAAPLLDAAKTRNASDAVRAVIDQLLASPPGSTPAALRPVSSHVAGLGTRGAEGPIASKNRRRSLRPARHCAQLSTFCSMICAAQISAGFLARDEGRMLSRLTRTMVKVLIASLIVGTILAHFGIRTDELIKIRRAVARADRGLGARRPRLGAAQSAARRAGDRSGLVRVLPVPAAGREPGLIGSGLVISRREAESEDAIRFRSSLTERSLHPSLRSHRRQKATGMNAPWRAHKQSNRRSSIRPDACLCPIARRLAQTRRAEAGVTLTISMPRSIESAAQPLRVACRRRATMSASAIVPADINTSVSVSRALLHASAFASSKTIAMSADVSTTITLADRPRHRESPDFLRRSGPELLWRLPEARISSINLPTRRGIERLLL